MLKLAETPGSTDRKLRSADSPKPESKKEKETKKQEKEKDDKDKQENGERDLEIIDLDQDGESFVSITHIYCFQPSRYC